MATTISETLREMIRASGQTHYALGKASGVDPAQIDRFMRGERDLRLGTLDKLAAVLNLQLFRTNPPETNQK